MVDTPTRMIRISLNEKDFTDLVAGKVITKDEGEEPVEICLQDIGLAKIDHIAHRAHIDFIKSNPPTPHI